MRYLLFLGIFFQTFFSLGQLKNCTLIANDGSELSIKYSSIVKKRDISKEIILLDSINNEIVITSEDYLKAEIGNSKFFSIKTKKGKKRFMEELVQGDNVSLYSHSFPYTVNIPGEGLSSGMMSDYYMKRGNVTFHVNVKDVLRRPERYFPANELLQDKIKRTKKSRAELILWAMVYNGQLSLKDLP